MAFTIGQGARKTIKARLAGRYGITEGEVVRSVRVMARLTGEQRALAVWAMKQGHK